MLFETPTQWAALAVALIAGWLFGLASHPGGRKWKQRYAEEREANASARREADERASMASARVKELERENARLASAASARPAATAPRAAAAARPAYPAGERRGWFDWGNRYTR